MFNCWKFGNSWLFKWHFSWGQQYVCVSTRWYIAHRWNLCPYSCYNAAASHLPLFSGFFQPPAVPETHTALLFRPDFRRWRQLSSLCHRFFARVPPLRLDDPCHPSQIPWGWRPLLSNRPQAKEEWTSCKIWLEQTTIVLLGNVSKITMRITSEISEIQS